MRAGGGRTRAEPEQRPQGGDLPRAVRVRIAASRVGGDRIDGRAQWGGPPPERGVDVGAAVSQKPEDVGVVKRRRLEERRDTVLVHVVHGGVGRALEYQPYEQRVRERPPL